MILGEVKTFPNVRADKAQALKPLEEAAETYSAWEDWTSAGDDDLREILLREIADCVTACCNLAAALGCEDMRPHLQETHERNASRGRYE